MIITVISDAKNASKKIISENGDNIFTFINVDVSLDKIHNAFHNHFILSRPLVKSIKNKRDSSLEPYYDFNAKYIVVDFDKVRDSKSIIQYFKNNNYTINLFESRNNLKAVVEIDFIASRSNIEAFLTMLYTHLDGLCEVDVASSRNASYQAPTKKENYLLLNENGVKPTLDDIKDFIPAYKPLPEYSDINIKWFWDKFIQDYNMIPKEYYNPNGTVQCSLPTEVKTKFSYYWSKDIPWLLQHPNKNKTLNIFSDFLKSDEGKEYIKNKKLDFFKDKFNIKADIKVKERYFTLTQEIKNIVDTSISTPNSVLVIKGIMGCGKSNIIEYINKPRTLYISVRRTLSYDIKEKYKCKHYIDDITPQQTNTSYRPGDSLVVQIDSLHKINTKYFDYVIIDEFESFCLYTQNNMLNSCDYFMKNMYIINELFKTKNIIIADAFINNFSLDLYFSTKKKYIIKNEYKDNIRVYSYEFKHTFISMLVQSVLNKKEDEIISCSFGTLNEMKAVRKMLELKGFNVLSLDSTTNEYAKEMASNMFKIQDNDLYDVILFSPTITVGISILNNVTNHFHYDTGRSIDAISSVQMTKRSRNAKYIHVFLKGSRRIKTCDIDILNNELALSIDDASKSDLFNYSTKEVSAIGKFINNFVAHTNFYTGDNKDIVHFLLQQQFNNITNIDEKCTNALFDKLCKENNAGKIILKRKYLDMQDYDINFTKKNLTLEDNIYQQALKLKSELFYLRDDIIIDIINQGKNIKEKVKYLIFYIKEKEIKEKEIKVLLMSSLKNIIIDREIIKNMKLLTGYNFKLMDFYTKKEIQNNTFNNPDFIKILTLLGYKKRNGGYYLPIIFKKILRQTSV